MVVSYSIHLFRTMMCRSTHLPFTCILCPYNHSDLRSHYKRILIIHLCSSLLSTSIYDQQRWFIHYYYVIVIIRGMSIVYFITIVVSFINCMVWFPSLLTWIFLFMFLFFLCVIFSFCKHLIYSFLFIVEWENQNCQVFWFIWI